MVDRLAQIADILISANEEISKNFTDNYEELRKKIDVQVESLKRDRAELDEKMMQWKRALTQLEIDRAQLEAARDRFNQEQRAAEEQLQEAQRQLEQSQQLHNQEVAEFIVRNDQMVRNAAMCLAVKEAKLEEIRSKKLQFIAAPAPPPSHAIITLVDASDFDGPDDIRKDETYGARKRSKPASAPSKQRSKKTKKKPAAQPPVQNRFLLTEVPH